MGTTARKPPAKPGNANQPVVQDTGVPAFMADAAKADAGKGTSQSAEDNVVPLLRVLQTNSPQCEKRDPEYVDGAEAGMLWLRGSGLPPIDGEIGLLFQPCFFSKAWNEWIPREDGGGFLGAHSERPLEAKEVPDPKDERKKIWMTPQGTELKETRNHVGYVIFPDGRAQPYVIPFSSSGHTVSRNWMALMNSKKVGESAAPSWAAKYRLKTKQRKNKKGTWFVIEVLDAGWIGTQIEYDRGRKLYEDFMSGAKIVEVDAAHDEDAEEETGDNARM